MDKNLRIRFQGKEYLLIGDMVKGGSIATEEEYRNFECSYAQLVPDGRVMRFRDSIGHRDEIEVIGEAPLMKQDTEKMLDVLFADDWLSEFTNGRRKLSDSCGEH